jgi:hypothetical protein
VRKRVEIHVDRLVLHGIPAGQRRAVEEAVQTELARIAAQDSAGEGGFARGETPAISPIRLPIGQPPARKPS